VRTFVSGAGGFIGRAVVRALARRGDAVVAHVGPPGCGLAVPPEAVASLEFELGEPRDLAPLLRDCDAVVHLAGPASVAASFSDPDGYLRAHALGTAALMRAAVGAGVPRFVYVSSAEVYGRSDAACVREDAPLQPRSPYAAAKVAGEAAVGAAARTSGTSAVILRPFSVYGPGQRATSLLATILAQAVRGERVAVRDLAPVRDYCHLDDVANAIALACEIRVDQVAAFNVGTGVPTSVGELIEEVFAALGRPGSYQELGADRGAAEIFRLVADPEQAANALGWRAEIALRDGILSALEAALA